MFTCEICGGLLVAGLCDRCIAEYGIKDYTALVEHAQEDFLTEWCVGECSEDEEAITAITFDILNGIRNGKRPEDMVRELGNDDIKGLYPMSLGALESTPCSVCGLWSTGLCCN